MPWSKVYNVGTPGWAGEVVSTTNGAFSGSFPAGRFAATPIVTVTVLGPIGATTTAIAQITAKSATGFAGTVTSLSSALGLAGETVEVIARQAG